MAFFEDLSRKVQDVAFAAADFYPVFLVYSIAQTKCIIKYYGVSSCINFFMMLLCSRLVWDSL